MEEIFYSLTQIPWTRLVLASSARGLAACQFVSRAGKEEARRQLAAAFPGAELIESGERNRRAAEELDAYAAGDLKEFSVVLDLLGTEFQKAAWRALLEIPYGETRTYGDIARAIGRPQAFRAVGLANHSNPVAIIVPCHRVIGSGGQLTGYGGGLPLKKALLEHERLHSPRHASARREASLLLWK